MDVLALSRLQFALTAMFHFIFVPMTLGVSILVAWMESKYLRTGDETWLKATKFFGKLFLINFALGLVTGITLEFQFGMNWSEYSRYVGDIFGAPLAIEATAAFFLESVFLGVWIFGWNKVSKKVHALAIWLAALATNLSALWIIIANGWMQHPVGFVFSPANHRAEMVDFLALVTNPTALLAFGHTLLSAYTLGAFFVLGVSAWHILRKNETGLFTKTFKAASIFGVIAIVGLVVLGDQQGIDVAATQPSKFAAMESHWETAEHSDMYLLEWPDRDEGNRLQAIGVPGLLSFLAFHDFNAKVTGLNDIAKDLRPPVLPIFLSFRLMVGLGVLMGLLALAALWFSHGKRSIENSRWLLAILVWAIPLPYLAIQLGWVLSEIGRQPWIVYGVLKTADAVSRSVPVADVWISLIGFVLMYSALGAVDIWLLFKYARKDPDGDLSKIVNVKGRS